MVFMRGNKNRIGNIRGGVSAGAGGDYCQTEVSAVGLTISWGVAGASSQP